jgi:hypothetical protein
MGASGSGAPFCFGTSSIKSPGSASMLLVVWLFIVYSKLMTILSSVGFDFFQHLG